MNRAMILQQLDERLPAKIRIPACGWVRTIRQALGMSLKQLAKKIEVDESTLSRLEKNESEGKVTLNSLKKMADGMDCDVVYTLIPREKSFQKMVLKQAMKYVRNKGMKVGQSMILEEQQVDRVKLEESYEKDAKSLAEKVDSVIWT